ncbi:MULTISPECIES: DICT sensory domain-containing protein [Trichocoleus]|uniref:histidine kinase n=1 Tax=Trichocoleus desertorum GB2-A4 TaxID=2933944 RepID=A0ABV0JC28_9CYAN|nr:DICT sensory domain-containing protein [Trichocoleus sp. FACHB-46]MBD1862925.1 GAF domain-containing protein [Trichocoleus sp. FACHB-46]
MSTHTSVLEALLQALPELRPQLYFKSSLTALSHAMEDQVLAGTERPLVIASFQRERFYRQEAHRYLRIAERTNQVYVLAAPETDFANRSGSYETIAFEPPDQLTHEWHLVVIGQQYASCLVCRERESPTTNPIRLRRDALPPPEQPAMDQTRRFEGVWTFDRQVTCQAAELLLDRVLEYRPELADKVAQAKAEFLGKKPSGLQGIDPDPFVERLLTYLQAGQYKLLKTYRSIAAQERKERLVNSISSAIRRSLNPDEIFKVAVQELGQTLRVCRCLMYRCRATDATATIQYEFLSPNAICADSAVDGATATAAITAPSLNGQPWPLQNNPLFQEIAQKGELIHIEDTTKDARITGNADLKALSDRWQIRSWLMVPLLYQDRLMGMVELHHCGALPHRWADDELSLVEAIATQVGVALIQAEAYANLEDLNQQLEAFDRTRSNLIAITGHELRTPLSTIQVCLESLASEPDMPLELRQVMLSTALSDAERMRKLVQDFLTLSRLESGRVQWNLEPLPLQECVDLALSSIHSRQSQEQLPQIAAQVPPELPLVRADGEWLVEVLSKLLENACKFTEPEGQVTIEARRNGRQMLEVTITDTGRGIEPNRLEAVFDRFYQEEGALRRTTGGTGLGLAICRQIITGLGGQIWAESAGRDQGSRFHFTIPISREGRETRSPNVQTGNSKMRHKRITTRP